jgi:hypothetical protein
MSQADAKISHLAPHQRILEVEIIVNHHGSKQDGDVYVSNIKVPFVVLSGDLPHLHQ